MDRFFAAYSFESVFLQNAKQFCLKVGRKLRDFIEKYRPTLCRLESPRSPRSRTRKSTAFVPEQFGFEKIFRNRGRIHDHEWGSSSAAAIVDCFGNKLFAGSGTRHR